MKLIYRVLKPFKFKGEMQTRGTYLQLEYDPDVKKHARRGDLFKARDQKGAKKLCINIKPETKNKKTESKNVKNTKTK